MLINSTTQSAPHCRLLFAILMLISIFPSAFAQSPNFASLACPQRVDALLDYWAKEKQKSNRTPCEQARLDVVIQRDLNSTALACPNDLTTIPSKLADYEANAKNLCGGKSNFVRQDSGNQCPTTINVAGTAVSVTDPINSEGGAQRALQMARNQLLSITRQGSCETFANRQECEINLKSWRDMVAALECHANAERSAGTDRNGSQRQATPAATGSGSPSQVQSRKGKAEDFLPFGDDKAGSTASGAAGTRTRSAAAGSGNSGAKAFLPFAEESGNSEPFPTPYCRFFQDATEQHDTGRRVCFLDVIYVCEDRSNANPKRAWKREPTGSRGCGGIRNVEAIERDRIQLKRLSKEMNDD